MIWKRCSLVAAVSGLTIWFVFGCGGAAQNAKNRNELKIIGLMYHNYMDRYNKPPAGVDDFEKLGAEYAEGVTALKSGKYVFIYGVGLNDMMNEGASNTVLGYESQAATNGGNVLMGDGFVKHMSAAEFQRAVKAQPKSKDLKAP